MPDVITTTARIARAYHRLSPVARACIADTDAELKAALDELMDTPAWQVDAAEAVEIPPHRLRRLPRDAAAQLDAALGTGHGFAPGREGVRAVLKLVDSWTEDKGGIVTYLPEDEPIPYNLDEDPPAPTVRVTDVREFLDHSGVPAPSTIDDPDIPVDDLHMHILAWLSDVVGVLRGYRAIHEQDMLAVGMGK
jgi:hypothetical protein